MAGTAFAAAAAPHPQPQATTVVRVAEELAEWLARFGSKAGRAEAAVRDAEVAVRQVLRSGEEITPEVAALVRREVQAATAIEGSEAALVHVDAALLRLMSKRPEIRDATWAVANRLRLREIGPRLERLTAELGDRAPAVLRALEGKLSEEEAALFMRGIGGRTLSKSQVTAVADALERSGLSPVERGDAWECVSRALLSGGSNRPASALREGGEVVAAQFNGIHGIDGVGAAVDGRPVIFEFSMDSSKALGETADGVQLSPAWTAARWNRAMERPELVERFRRIGVADTYLRPVTAAEAVAWPRKLAVAHESALTDSNRLRAGIGPDDLFVLGAP